MQHAAVNHSVRVTRSEQCGKITAFRELPGDEYTQIVENRNVSTDLVTNGSRIASGGGSRWAVGGKESEDGPRAVGGARGVGEDDCELVLLHWLQVVHNCA